MKVNTKEVRELTAIIDDIIADYKDKNKEGKRDWRTYEQRVAHRLKKAFNELKPLVVEAVKTIKVVKANPQGSKPAMTLEQKVLALLLKHLFGRSNREMSFMLIIFSWLTDVSVSYKTIERLYSDEQVKLALHNLHVLILKKKGIREVEDGGGDGTGYALTIKKHYCTEAQMLKDKIKENTSKEKKKTIFVYSFVIMDLNSRMHIGIGTSFKSEKAAFMKALDMTQELDINIKSLRLDKYFSCQYYAKLLGNHFSDVKLYLLPKSNATVKGPWNWKKMLYEYVTDPISYLQEYFKRNQTESNFAEDKKRIGWKLGQKRPDRISTSNFCTSLWHNLCWLGT